MRTEKEKYLPRSLSTRDKRKQGRELRKSRRLYNRGIYHSRPKVDSFRSRKSSHVQKAEKMYGVKSIGATAELARKTGCSRSTLAGIIRKGEGAYYSSGSRPNQTAQSWGVARLASAITAGKASKVDFHLLREGCNRNSSKALRLASQKKKKR